MSLQLSITRELLASTADDDLERLLTNYVLDLQKNDPDKLDSLPVGIQDVFIIASLDADVVNGGFNQYLFNSPAFAIDAPSAFRNFGLHDAASLAEQALQRFDSRVRERHAAARAAGTMEAFMATYQDDPFTTLNKRYWASSEHWRVQRIAYIRQHADEFLHG